jgi:hypothetical protein
MTQHDPELVECDVHGSSLPAFVCRHLMQGEDRGFYNSGTPAPDESRPDAWCRACEAVRLATGGSWTADNEPELGLVCAECWDGIRSRNFTGREDDWPDPPG